MKIREQLLANFLTKTLNLDLFKSFHLNKLIKKTAHLNLDERLSYILTEFDIKNFWVKIPKEKISQIPLPAISIPEPESAFPLPVAIQQINDETNNLLELSGNTREVNLYDFFNAEQTYVLLFENETQSKTWFSGCSLKKIKVISSMVFAFALLGFFFLVLSLNEFFLMLFAISGIGLFVWIIHHSSGREHNFLNKVCKVTNSDCNEIFQFKPFNLSLFDFKIVGLAFFISMFLSLIVQIFIGFDIIFVFSFFVLIGAVGVLLSWGIQMFYYRKKCIICLLVSFLICLIIFHNIFFYGFDLTKESVSCGFGFLSISYIFSFYFSSAIEQKHLSDSLIAESIAIKSNTEIFNFLLDEGLESSFPETVDLPVKFGNESGHNIGIVISLKCNKCYEMLSGLLSYVSTFDNINLKIWFAADPKRISKEEIKVLNVLLHERVKNNLHVFLNVLKEWYENKQIVDYKVNEERDLFIKGIKATPMVFHNMKLIPSFYQFDDLKYLLNKI